MKYIHIIISIMVINFLLSLYFLSDMITFDGTYYLRYNSWSSSFPFGYPLIVSFFKIFISNEVLAGGFATAFFGSALLYPLSQILIHLFSKKIGMLLLLIAMLNPVVLYYSSVTYSELPFFFFLIFSLWMYYKDKQFLAVLFASISYLIRPEGLIFAIGYIIIFTIKDRKWKGLLIATLLSILLLFMVENHSRKGEWIISSKTSNINLKVVDNWRMNEEIRHSSDVPTIYELTQNTIKQYPKRFLITLNLIKESSTLPLVIIGTIGLLSRINILWLFVFQLLLTPLAGMNMPLRLGLPYFYALLIGSGFLIQKSKKKIQASIIFVILVSIFFIPNLKYLSQPVDSDFSYIECKKVGLLLKDIMEDAIVMDRKPYVAFYSNAGKYIEIPTGSINDVFLSIQKNNVDFLVLSERVIKIFRPNLIPLLTIEEQIVEKYLTTIYNDININKGFGIRIYKIKRNLK